MKSSHLVAILLVWMLPLTTHSLAASYDIVDLGAFPGTLSVSGLNEAGQVTGNGQNSAQQNRGFACLDARQCRIHS